MKFVKSTKYMNYLNIECPFFVLASVGDNPERFVCKLFSSNKTAGTLTTCNTVPLVVYNCCCVEADPANSCTNVGQW